MPSRKSLNSPRKSVWLSVSLQISRLETFIGRITAYVRCLTDINRCSDSHSFVTDNEGSIPMLRQHVTCVWVILIRYLFIYFWADDLSSPYSLKIAAYLPWIFLIEFKSLSIMEYDTSRLGIMFILMRFLSFRETQMKEILKFLN